MKPKVDALSTPSNGATFFAIYINRAAIIP